MTTYTVQPNERVTFGVCHEDDDLLVVLKPPQVVTQPGVGHEHDTLLNGLFARCGDRLQQLGRARDFGLVHRLDRETSGLVAVALSPDAYDRLREAFATRAVKKFYWAICHKAPREPSGVIKRPIIEEERRKSRYTSEKRARLSNDGKPAVTAFRVLDANEMAALIEARPVTGRLHQVRVHLDSVGAGILGDSLYGPSRTTGAAHRLALHAHRIVFDHPVTGERMDISTPFPRDLRGLLRRLNLRRPDLEPQAETAGDDED
ncbi:MAG: RluA family pseudouridine synthase [Phycisphaeraceae bacterium]|nr:MAG: RluA family pseudouridine synthase [Phycisphaeraceae bacterium]